MASMGEQQEEKSAFGIFEFQWKLINIPKKTILSNMIDFRGQKLFRVGLKNQGTSSPTLLFLTTDLAKMGLKVDTVLFSTTQSFEEKKMLLKTEKAEGEFGRVQLFTALVNGGTVITGNESYTFTVYIIGVVEDYKIQQKDSLLTNELWLSARNRIGTDFEIIAANKKIFPVHKFILAARSPVFAAQFNEKEVKFKQVFEVDATCMEQFLKFIYTGELEGSITSPKLKELATAYQIKTLESICEASSAAPQANFNGDEMARLVLELQPEAESNPVEIRSGADSVGNLSSDSVILNYMWKWNQWKEKYSTITSAEAFEHKREKLFRSQAKQSTRPSKFTPGTRNHEFTITFLTTLQQKSGFKIKEVACSAFTGSSLNFLTWKRMIEKPKVVDEDLLQMLTSTEYRDTQYSREYSPPFTVTFHIQAVSTVANYDFKFTDTTWEEQIWNAAVNKKFTDVEFLVGDQSFAAHRFLLSSRSPVFAAMFNSGMEEARTGQVTIDDTDPNIFRTFLEFLYVGDFKPYFIEKEQLFALADKYQVETLMALCKPIAEPSVNIDDFTKVFLSYY